jgi:hypothetical protein
MNGSDEEELPPTQHSDTFVLAYAGSIYIDRDPRILFRAMAHVIKTLKLSPARMCLEFVGHVERYGETSLRDIAADEGIADFLSTTPPMPRSQLKQYLAHVTMLVSLPQEVASAIPAKIFEYVRQGAWILALAQPQSATASLLQGTQADIVEPNDVLGIAEVIQRRYKQFETGERPAPVDSTGRFARSHQARLLLRALEEHGLVAQS